MLIWKINNFSLILIIFILHSLSQFSLSSFFLLFIHENYKCVNISKKEDREEKKNIHGESFYVCSELFFLSH